MYKTELHHRGRKKTENKTFFREVLLNVSVPLWQVFLFVMLLLFFKGHIREITLGGGPGVL